MDCRESLAGGKELVTICFSLRVEARLLRTLVSVGKMTFLDVVCDILCPVSPLLRWDIINCKGPQHLW